MRRLSAFFLCAVPMLLCFSSACATGDGMTDKLYDTTRGYNRALRWGDYDRASEHLPISAADAFLDLADEYRDKLVVIDYDMTRIKINKQDGTAATRVELQWHTDDRLIVEKTILEQIWQWFDGRWFLVDEHRVSGEKMAFFAEEDDDDDQDGTDSPEEQDEHPYLPGLQQFREARGIGLEGAEKSRWERKQRKIVKNNGLPLPEDDKPSQPKAETPGEDEDSLLRDESKFSTVETDRRPLSFN